jgi:hypothetical protein
LRATNPIVWWGRGGGQNGEEEEGHLDNLASARNTSHASSSVVKICTYSGISLSMRNKVMSLVRFAMSNGKDEEG